MPLVLLVAFIVVPLVELAVIIQVGSVIGVAWTILLLLAMSVLGAALVRREGRRAWMSFREAIAQGRWPGDEVVHGALVLVGGALLLTPGFVTDAIGLLVLAPPTRALVARLVRARITPLSGQVLREAAGRGGTRARPDGAARPRDEHAEALDVEVVSVERDDTDEAGRAQRDR